LNGNTEPEGENTSENVNDWLTTSQTQIENLTSEGSSISDRGPRNLRDVETRLYTFLNQNRENINALSKNIKSLIGRINTLDIKQKEDNNQIGKELKTLKSDMQNINATLTKVPSKETNQDTIDKIEETSITWTFIVLIIWNTTLTIICAYHWCSPNRNGNSANASDSHMESPVCINPIYATSTDMTDYNSTPENRGQPNMDQLEEGQYCEI
jgi:TolA-binding protein